MTEEQKDASYLAGKRMAYLELFDVALRGLGRDNPKWTEKRWLSEREQTVALLRTLCEERGDNDWPDDLHLVDIIENHLAPYLRPSMGS